MSKTRVHELAKTLKIESKELIEKLKQMNIEVKTHMSVLKNEDIDKILSIFPKKNTEDKTTQPKEIKDKDKNKFKGKDKDRKDIDKSKDNKPKDNKFKDNNNNNNNRKDNRFKDNNRFRDKDNKSRDNNNKSRDDKFRDNKNDNRPKDDKFRDNKNDNRPRDNKFKDNRNNNRPKDNKFNDDRRNNRPRDNKFNDDRRDNRPRDDKFNDNRSRDDKFRDNRLRDDKFNDNKFKDNSSNRKDGRFRDDKFKDDKKENRFNDDKKDSKFRDNKLKSNKKSIEPKKSNIMFENNENEIIKKNKKKKKQNKNDLKQDLPAKEESINENIEDDIKIIQLPSKVTVKELSEKLDKNSTEIVMALMKIGIMATINQEIDFDIASIIADSYNVIAEEAKEIDLLEEAFKEDDDTEEDSQERPPVVVVMGHVDHGKTSLLDAIRHSKVTANEAGGITQHIGAYTVSIDNKPITFLDTPGHEAFTAMRMRGAQVTDIAILVVAADDGVMPQTIEAINHAKAANVEIIVAINKIDKPSANADRVKQELVEYGLVSEDWGGQTICVPVSAMSKTGIDQLLEMIILVSEMKELKANPNKRARGTIIEAQLDKGRGPVATVLVQNGTLKVGDPVIAGSCYGKVRAMMNDKGQKVKKAGPSIPVEILGLSEVPQAGDMFYVAQNEKQARQVAESVIAKGREDLIKNTHQKVSLDDLFNQIQAGSVKELNIVIKADVQGSVEAVKMSLEKLSNKEVHIKTIHGGVGAITESDVMLASASNAIIIGFNVRPESSAKSVAEDQKVDIRLYRVIYNAIEDITAAMKGMLDPVYEEKIIGHAEIRQLFKASGVGTIGGSYVTDGKVARNCQVRIVRDGTVIYEGELSSLRRGKDDVKDVNSGYECGLLFNKFNDIKEGDIVEAFIMEEIPQ